ncbi:MAG: glutamine-hydrolyzing GMP synthase, partial [Lentisphaerae bacterium]|nr:glutamine-hydrolyzing GMP synthase [Lentisphaerota bacterium]
MKQDMIVILDLGSTQNTVLARQIRALGVYSEIYPHDIAARELKALPNVKGVILSGGPNNVVDGRRIDVKAEIYKTGIPVMAVAHPRAKCELRVDAWPKSKAGANKILKPFLFETCKAAKNWNMKNFVADQVELVRQQVGGGKVLLALSGGVDSSVVAALLVKAIGPQIECVHVNHGLMRKNESEDVVKVFRDELGANLAYLDVADRFLDKLAGVADPERK